MDAELQAVVTEQTKLRTFVEGKFETIDEKLDTQSHVTGQLSADVQTLTIGVEKLITKFEGQYTPGEAPQCVIHDQKIGQVEKAIAEVIEEVKKKIVVIEKIDRRVGFIITVPTVLLAFFGILKGVLLYLGKTG